MVMIMGVTLYVICIYIYIYIYIYIRTHTLEHGAGSLQMVAVSLGHDRSIEQLGTCLGMVSAAVVIAM